MVPKHNPTESRDLGRWAESTAFALWPELLPVSPGSCDDMGGTDARTPEGHSVQVKADWEADRTGNLFWEIAKCGGDWNAYGASDEWHMSPSGAHIYIFVSQHNAYRVPVIELIRAAQNQTPKLTDTAFAFLVPIAQLGAFHERRRHNALPTEPSRA